MLEDDNYEKLGWDKGVLRAVEARGHVVLIRVDEMGLSEKGLSWRDLRGTQKSHVTVWGERASRQRLKAGVWPGAVQE